MLNMDSTSNRLTTTYRDVYPSSHNLRRQPMPHENTQTPIPDEYSAGTNRTAGPMALGTSSDTNADSRTVTLEWQRTGGAWTQTQVLATDPIRDPYVHSNYSWFAKCKTYARVECHRFGQRIYD